MLTLSDLKAFMIERRRVTLTEISLHFDTPASAIRPMLAQWAAKGRVRQLEVAGCCGKTGTACACSSPPAEVFEWLP